MLCLWRRRGEEIYCTLTKPMPAGTRIVVVVTDIGRGRAHIGIDCDRSITVDRSEIDARKRAEAEEDPNGKR